jgi:oligoribonuclease NrnB/cAMP/cGMP phosphodiesterase (DHH superfamily)
MNSLRTLCNPKDINIIIYHNPCMDGYASAFIAQYYIKSNNLKLIPKLLDGKSIDINEIKDKNVLMVDIVCENYEEIYSYAKTLIILDHHKTNQDKLKNVSYAHFDMHKSGVGLAWEYFNEDKDMPLFLKCIQDRDLWTWIIPESRYFCDYLYEEVNYSDHNFEVLTSLMNNPENLNEYYNIGKILNKIKMKNIETLVKFTSKLIEVNIEENKYNIYIYNTITDVSDIGNYVMENLNCDFVVVWNFNHMNNTYKYSLRSIDSKIDISCIAKIFDGGGHRNASGFTSNKHPNDLFNINTDK